MQHTVSVNIQDKGAVKLDSDLLTGPGIWHAQGTGVVNKRWLQMT